MSKEEILDKYRRELIGRKGSPRYIHILDAMQEYGEEVRDKAIQECINAIYREDISYDPLFKVAIIACKSELEKLKG